jgi:hypothetical protein
MVERLITCCLNLNMNPSAGAESPLGHLRVQGYELHDVGVLGAQIPAPQDTSSLPPLPRKNRVAIRYFRQLFCLAEEVRNLCLVVGDIRQVFWR